MKKNEAKEERRRERDSEIICRWASLWCRTRLKSTANNPQRAQETAMALHKEVLLTTINAIECSCKNRRNSLISLLFDQCMVGLLNI